MGIRASPLHKPRESKLSNIGHACVRAFTMNLVCFLKKKSIDLCDTFISCTMYMHSIHGDCIAHTMRDVLYAHMLARAHTCARDYLCVCVAINV